MLRLVCMVYVLCVAVSGCTTDPPEAPSSQQPAPTSPPAGPSTMGPVSPDDVVIGICLDSRVAVEASTDARHGQHFGLWVASMPDETAWLRVVVQDGNGTELLNQTWDGPPDEAENSPLWFDIPAVSQGTYRMQWGPEARQAAFDPFNATGPC
jgi:hypothetical protein